MKKDAMTVDKFNAFLESAATQYTHEAQMVNNALSGRRYDKIRPMTKDERQASVQRSIKNNTQ